MSEYVCGSCSIGIQSGNAYSDHSLTDARLSSEVGSASAAVHLMGGEGVAQGYEAWRTV